MQVSLRNLKSISRLDFEIPRPGVWIVTGLNGSGKTSLFAAIYRLGAKHAFQRFYRTNAIGSRVDSYPRARVEYTIGGSTVTYRYGGQRWRATPKSLAGLVSRSPYPSVQFVEASGDRIEPFADEISSRRIRDASQEMRDFMTEVLGDSKWGDLRYVNTRRGRNNDAYLIPHRVSGTQHYFSERSFSLGELCVLKLAKKLLSVREMSMLLVDEVEMALHPQAQVRLLKSMQRIAREKDLTVLFSTHSTTLIKNTDRRNLILLHQEGTGRVEVVVGAYPAQVLGEIAFADETASDFVFYVEDDEARLLLEQLVRIYVVETAVKGIHQPLYRVVPVGGFREVVRMVGNSSSILPPHIKRFAFLDKDAEGKAHNMENVKFLPCTPELGLINHLEQLVQTRSAELDKLNRCVEGCVLNLAAIVTSSDYTRKNKSNARARAKDRLNYLVEELHRATGCSSECIRRKLYGEFCSQKYGEKVSSILELFGPVFNAV